MTIHAAMAAYKLGGIDALRELGFVIPDYETLISVMTKCVGSASMCWDRVANAGMFDSRMAIQVAERYVEALVKELVAHQLVRRQRK